MSKVSKGLIIGIVSVILLAAVAVVVAKKCNTGDRVSKKAEENTKKTGREQKKFKNINAGYKR